MAFKLAQNPSYIATVKVSMPNDKDGFDTSEFKAKFKRPSTEEIKKFGDKTKEEVVKEYLVGFTNLLDENNQEVDFNEDNLNALIAIPQALDALFQTFQTTLFKAREKN